MAEPRGAGRIRDPDFAANSDNNSEFAKNRPFWATFGAFGVYFVSASKRLGANSLLGRRAGNSNRANSERMLRNSE
jgi:hypothetical protein